MTSVVHSFKDPALYQQLFSTNSKLSSFSTPEKNNPAIKMRFSVFAATFLASATAVLAGESTIYVTDEITITSCHSTVTNCPARSTVTSTTTYPVITSSSAPVYANSSAPVSSPPYTVVPPPVSVATSAGVSSYPVSSPVSLSTITISTCVPTVIYSTITVAGVSSTPAPSGTGSISYSKNVTAPSATATPSAFTGSASSIQASFGIGAVAAIAAFFL